VLLILAVPLFLAGCAKAQDGSLNPAADFNLLYLNQTSPISSLKGFGVGQAAPDFSFVDRAGQVQSLSSLRGKAVILNFWSSNCPPCRAEMPLFDQAYRNQSYRDRGLVVITVNLDEDSKGAEQFILNNHYSLPFILDPGWKIGSEYSVFEYPSTFLIDRSGVIQARKEGPFINENDLNRSLSEIVG
jgi:peroxiredoxin